MYLIGSVQQKINLKYKQSSLFITSVQTFLWYMMFDGFWAHNAVTVTVRHTYSETHSLIITWKYTNDCDESVLISFSSREDAAMRFHCWHCSYGKQLWTWVLLKAGGCTYRDSNNNFCLKHNYQNRYIISCNAVTASEECVIRFHCGRRAQCCFISLTRWSFHDLHTTWPDAEATLMKLCSILSCIDSMKTPINHSNLLSAMQKILLSTRKNRHLQLVSSFVN